uniref:Uncharacterized protein n=1 Tax=Anguilla anguilla TaxID=7936 RepID=A0A0E9T2Z1_ANGAN
MYRRYLILVHSYFEVHYEYRCESEPTVMFKTRLDMALDTI